MKKNILIIIGLITFFGCSKGGEPQFLEPTQNGPTTNQGAVNSELARTAGIQHLIYHVGPVDLPANTGVEKMLESPLSMKFQVDNPVWVIGFEPKVIDAAGAALPSALLHHAIVSNLHEENPVFSEGTGGNPFVSATATLTKLNLPEGYGYPILSEDPLEAKVVLYNPTKENYVDVSFELYLTAKPMNELAGMKDVKPMLLDIEPCSHAPVDIEPQKFVKRQATFTIPDAGNLLIATGALQDYGAFVELTKQTDAMPFWKAEAVLDENHHIIELSNNPFEDPAGIKLKKGDSITIGAAYDNTETTWLKGASAAAMIYVAGE